MEDGQSKELNKSIKSYIYSDKLDKTLFFDVIFENTYDITPDILYPDYLVVQFLKPQMIVDEETFAMLDPSEASNETTAIPPQYTE